MSETANPHIGNWYKNANGDKFEVVAIDEEESTIEVQHFDGTVEEIDFDDWVEEQCYAIEAPEDWSGSYDIEREDYGVDLDSQFQGNKRNPLEDFDQ